MIGAFADGAIFEDLKTSSGEWLLDTDVKTSTIVLAIFFFETETILRAWEDVLPHNSRSNHAVLNQPKRINQLHALQVQKSKSRWT